jgi:hypothetical protein
MDTKLQRSNPGLLFLLIIAIFLCSAFQPSWNSPVKGSVNPPNGGVRAWLMSKTDTVNAPVIEGTFMITNVKAGTYLLMIEGRPPYKDSYKQDILVVDGQPTDVGVVEMNK